MCASLPLSFCSSPLTHTRHCKTKDRAGAECGHGGGVYCSHWLFFLAPARRYLPLLGQPRARRPLIRSERKRERQRVTPPKCALACAPIAAPPRPGPCFFRVFLFGERLGVPWLASLHRVFRRALRHARDLLSGALGFVWFKGKTLIIMELRSACRGGTKRPRGGGGTRFPGRGRPRRRLLQTNSCSPCVCTQSSLKLVLLLRLFWSTTHINTHIPLIRGFWGAPQKNASP